MRKKHRSLHENCPDIDHGGGSKGGRGPVCGNWSESSGLGDKFCRAFPRLLTLLLLPPRPSGPSVFPQNAHTHRHTQIHRHSHKNTHRHIQIHRRIPRHTQTQTHTHTHIYTYTHARHRNTQAHRHPYTHSTDDIPSQGPPPVSQIFLSSAPSHHQTDPLKLTLYKKWPIFGGPKRSTMSSRERWVV